MALVLNCEKCGRRVKVSSHMTGRDVSCPHCKARVHVPGELAPRDRPPPLPAAPAPPATAPQPAPPIGFNGGVTLRSSPASRDPDSILVSRRVIYTQGVLLLLVGVCSTAAGYFLALSYGPVRAAAPQPCFITGKVQYVRDSTTLPDAGTVVLLFPKGTNPDRFSKLAVHGLRPEDDPVGPSDTSMQSLRSLGGDMCRASGDGFYHLRVRDVGGYYLLFLSAHAQRDEGAGLDRRVLAELGRYVDRANEILADAAFDWREMEITGDEEINVVFR
jgi:DNA-directed RNA polymerase subunit RPC12/RpoP